MYKINIFYIFIIFIIYMKIFVIGFNKTGTSSLHQLFIELGIKSTHSVVPVMSIINNFDAFTDGDHFNFKEYYNKYPDSLFILNTRPISKWLISRYKHAKFHKFKESWCWPISEEKTNKWITEREIHYQNIYDFFLDKPKQLLIINIEKEGWEIAVSRFIQKPEIIKNKIHKNKRELENKNVIKLITENVSKCLTQRGYNGDELLFNNSDTTLYEYTTLL